MARQSIRAVVAASIVAVLALTAACGGDDTTSAPPAEPASGTTAAGAPESSITTPSVTQATTTTTTTTTSLLPATTATTTTTTVPAAGEGTPATGWTFPPDDRPDAFTVHFEEYYVCQLGPAGESEIHAWGSIAATLDPSQSEFEVVGEGDLSVEGFVRGGDICAGEAVGTHRVRELNGTIDVPSEGAPTLTLHVTGTWYETWDGELVCPGLPLSGPWEWPPEFNVETLEFAPFEDGATWEKDVSVGMCDGTVTRTIEL